MVGVRRIREKLREALAQDMDPRRIAGGFAVGVFFSFSPLISLHILMAVAAAVLLRVSKVGAVAGCWVNNPYTMPFVYYFCFRLGQWILRSDLVPPDFGNLTFAGILRAALPYAAPLFLGATILGIVASAVSYAVVYRVALRIQSARRTETD